MRKYLEKCVKIVPLLVVSGYAAAESWPECDIPHSPMSSEWGDMVAIDSCISNIYTTSLNSEYSVNKSRSVQIESLIAGDAKAGIISIGQYVSLKNSGDTALIPIAAMPMSHGKIGFYSQLISKNLTDIGEISDLETNKIQLQSSAAITGLSAPFKAILDYLPSGAIPKDLSINSTVFDEEAAALEPLRVGALEVSSWWSTESDTSAQMFGDETEYNVLWSSPIIPHTAIVVNRDIGQVAIDKFRNSLLNMDDDALTCVNDSLAWEIEGFQSVNESDYEYAQDAFNVGLTNKWIQDHHSKTYAEREALSPSLTSISAGSSESSTD